MRYVLDIRWATGIDLPALVGPFDSSAEAEVWAELNCPNGIPAIRPLAGPYASPRRAANQQVPSGEPS